MDGMEAWKAATACAAHALLFTFTIVLVLKLHHVLSCSWWLVFSPIWFFHVVVAGGRFSIPAPSGLDGFPYAPFHAVVATPLLIAFELLLCTYLETSYVNQVAAVNLKVIFLPVFLFETIVIIDNLRMCCPLIKAKLEMFFLGEEFAPDMRELRPDVQSQRYIHYLTTVSMAFIQGATVFVFRNITGDTAKLALWGPFCLFSIGQFCAYLVFLCDMGVRREFQKNRDGSPSSRIDGYLNQVGALVVQVDEDQNLDRLCIGGHVVTVLIVGFQALLLMYLQGTPAKAREIPIPYIFSPLFLLQGVGVVFSLIELVETIVLLLCKIEGGNGRYVTLSSKARDFLEFIRHGSRFLGWWSFDEGSREVQARRLDDGESGNRANVVKKMQKKDLVEEVWTLQVAITDQMKVVESSQWEYDRLQNEKVLCKVCFVREISVVLLPCRHRILCWICCKKCLKCPICRVSISW